jgi:hypothetical protein
MADAPFSLFPALIAATIAKPAVISDDFDGDGRPNAALFVADFGAANLETSLFSQPGTVCPVPGAEEKAENFNLETLPPSRYSPLCRVARARK